MSIAIVTGASSGMGREFVRQLHQYIRPDEIWAIARRKAALEELAQETDIPVRPIVLDLGKEESFRKFAALLEAEKPEIRLLVNAAGFGVKLQVLGVKLLPHKLVIKTWMNQQKKPLNNQGLTK